MVKTFDNFMIKSKGVTKSIKVYYKWDQIVFDQKIFDDLTVVSDFLHGLKKKKLFFLFY